MFISLWWLVSCIFTLKLSSVWWCFLLGSSAKRECYERIHRKPSVETRPGGLQMSQVLQHQAWPSTPLQVGQKQYEPLTAAFPNPISQLKPVFRTVKSHCYYLLQISANVEGTVFAFLISSFFLHTSFLQCLQTLHTKDGPPLSLGQ